MKKLFTWKVLRRLLICFVGFITLLAVIWAVENFQGKRAWNKYQAELQARGETLDIKALAPAPIPDEKNFALAPFFTNLVFAHSATPGSTKSESAKPDLVRIGEEQSNALGNQQRWNKQGVSLTGMQEYYRSNTNFPRSATPQSPAEDVLLALTRLDSDFNGLHKAAAERPDARFPIHYEDIFSVLLPHYVPLRQASLALLVRSTANLELGRREEALRDIQLAFRLADSIKDEPLLISFLVRQAMMGVNVQIAKEGLMRHAWTDSDLSRLQELLGKADLLDGYMASVRGERAFSTSGLQTLIDGNPVLPEGPGTEIYQMGRLVPRGWIYHNQLSLSKWLGDYMLTVVDPTKRRFHPEMAEKASESLVQMQKSWNPYTMFARLFPAVMKVSMRTAEIQATVDQAIIACALERFHLANKNYPATLEQLAPKYLTSIPHDLITGEPMKYKQNTDGTYALYSVGWDAKDNGGLPVLTDKPSQRDEPGRDWVWQMPAIRE